MKTWIRDRSAALVDSPRSFDVRGVTPGKHGNHRSADLLRDQLRCMRVVLRGNRKTDFEDVDPENFQLPGELQLLLRVHREARGLFPVAQGRVEDDQSIVYHDAS